ncbi:MAG: hypothetical protein RLZZ360_693 [Candidatus Parcubacteria bacterium]|jgi:hypothetical protein
MSAPALKKVHTFADDLNLVRGKQGIVMKKPPTVVHPGAATPAKNNAVRVAETVPAGPKKILTTTKDTLRPSANDLPATVITDQRGKRFNLTSEMSSAIADWWNEKIKSVKKTNKKNLYGLPAAERRKGVIHTATTYTGRQATSDYEAVVTRVKTSESTKATPTPTQPKVATELDITTETTGWTTDTAMSREQAAPVAVPSPASIISPLPPIKQQEQNQIQVTNITYRQPASEILVPHEAPHDDFATVPDNDSTSEIGVDELPETLPEVQATTITPIVVPPPRTFEKIAPQIPETPPTVTPMVAPSIQRNNTLSLLGEIPEPKIQNKPEYVKASIAARKETLENTQTSPRSMRSLSALAPYLAGGMFVLVSVGSITYFMFSSNTDDSDPSTANTTLPVTPNTPADTASGNSLTQSVTARLDAPNKASLFAAIAATTGTGEGLQLVTPLAHDSNLPLSSREILNLLNRQFSPVFIGNITQVHVGMYREEPVIILTVSDSTNARGGMYSWETTMSQDLSPWFGLPLAGSQSVTGSAFLDSTSAGYDIRILKDDIGTERIVYGVVGPSTVIITTSSLAFLNITQNYNRSY